MRLIDADKLYDDIARYRDENMLGGGNLLVDDILEDINLSPTVDAVPVVRCGWCPWFRKGYCVHPAQDMIPVMAGHFCGYGYRKEGD